RPALSCSLGDVTSIFATVVVPAVVTPVAVGEVAAIGAVVVPVPMVLTGEPPVIPVRAAVAMIVARVFPASVVPGATSVLAARMSFPSMVVAIASVTSSTTTASAGEGVVRNSEDQQPCQEHAGA